MGEIVFLEIIGRKGMVKDCLRLTRFPVTVGRAYSNDIIIDDRFVCPEHLRITCDDQNTLIVEDLGSRNGLYQLSPSLQVERIIIPRDTTEAQARIGNTVLRFRRQGFKVTPAEDLPLANRYVFGLHENPLMAAGVFALGFVMALITIYQSSYEEQTSYNVIIGGLLVLLLFMLWTGLWSIVTRIVSQTFRFFAHLSVAGTFMTVAIGTHVAFGYLEFIFSPDEYFFDLVNYFFSALLCSVLLYGHLAVISPGRSVRRLVLPVLIPFGIMGIFGYMAYTEQTGFSNDLHFQGKLKPYGHQLIRTLTTQEFFSKADKLRQTVDALALEK